MNPRVELFVQKAIRFILILCGGEGSQKESKHASDINRQFRQADVMLKSAVLFTR